MEQNTIQNRIRIDGLDYYFLTDVEATAGSENPIASKAVYELIQQLHAFLGKDVTVSDSLTRHPIVDGKLKTFNDNSIASSEAVRTALDDVYNKFEKIKSAFEDLGLTNFNY